MSRSDDSISIDLGSSIRGGDTPHISEESESTSYEVTSVPEVKSYEMHEDESGSEDLESGRLIRALRDTIFTLRRKLGGYKFAWDAILVQRKRRCHAANVVKRKLESARQEIRGGRWSTRYWCSRALKVGRKAKETEAELKEMRRELQAVLNDNALAPPDNEPVCCICLQRAPTVLFLPCKHLAYCLPCSKKDDVRNRCPACRGVPDQVLETIVP